MSSHSIALSPMQKISHMHGGQLKNVGLSIFCLLSVCYLSVDCQKFIPNYLLNHWSDWNTFLHNLEKICILEFYHLGLVINITPLGQAPWVDSEPNNFWPTVFVLFLQKLNLYSLALSWQNFDFFQGKMRPDSEKKSY